MVSFTGACPISAREGEAKFWITLYVYSVHLWILLRLFCQQRRGFERFIREDCWSSSCSYMSNVPVYLKFADKPYDFKMDVKKIDSENVPAAHFLVGLGTVGWGFWVVALSILGLAFLGAVFCNH